MPVPQENLSVVEQASCLLLTMVQDISMNQLFSEVTKLTLAGLMAIPNYSIHPCIKQRQIF
ncbi:hypothetical protein [Microcoleus sp. OTE_8_concoct_300]|uniref:hypothetical protein n=1 Tax=Microcoleus sp. OTE_8_concoct_300 TaxID=2964710 RepID=UPI00403F8725